VLLRDRHDSLRFATIDCWDSFESYESFLGEHQAEYAAIDALCSGWTTEEARIGGFEVCDSA
jgi:hypothetical protein